MPNREFLEICPLYRKFPMKIDVTLNTLGKPAIHMRCPSCGTDQTFNMINQYCGVLHGPQEPAAGKVVRAVYQCTACKESGRHFLLKFDPKGEYVMKVGQEPPWDITPDPDLEKALGPRSELYKKGLICESQNYGIGAFAYYRRTVEELIDELLADIPALMTGKEKEQYLDALEKTRKTTIAQDKIDVVKELLPAILRPGGVNPLTALHKTLSVGLHGKSDDECIEMAETVRTTLEFLVNTITRTKTEAARFTDGMRKLLHRKKKPNG